MVLNGTLKEFILADVFNLLTQQRITGRLDLASGKREALIVFKDGSIVGGEDGEDTLGGKLFNYLVDIKRKTPEQLSPIFGTHAKDLSALSAALLERNFLTSAELRGFAGSFVEDICCSLLTWNEGTYRFNSVGSVSDIACGVVTISAENIIMEGMRRVDEWARMKDYITDDMVFAPAPNSGGGVPPGEIDIAAAPEEYIFGLLDGSGTVKSIKKSCCLCEYKVYESINFLLQAHRITAMQQHYSDAIKAALARKEAEVASVLRATFFSSLVAALVAAAFVAFFVFFRIYLLPKLDAGTHDRDIAEHRRLSETKESDAVQSASLLYRAVVGGPAADDPEALKKAGFLTDRDLYGRADIYGRITER